MDLLKKENLTNEEAVHDEIIDIMIKSFGKVPEKKMTEKMRIRLSDAIAEESASIKVLRSANRRKRIFRTIGTMAAVFTVGFISINMYNNGEDGSGLFWGDNKDAAKAEYSSIGEKYSDDFYGINSDDASVISDKVMPDMVSTETENESSRKEIAKEEEPTVSLGGDVYNTPQPIRAVPEAENEGGSEDKRYYLELLSTIMGNTTYEVIDYEKSTVSGAHIFKVRRGDDLITFEGSGGELKIIVTSGEE